MERTFTFADYLAFIKDTIRKDGWRIADTANKLALESHTITTEEYSKSARIIADAFLATI